MASPAALNKIGVPQRTHPRALCGLHLPAGTELIWGGTQFFAYNKKSGVLVPAEALGRKCSFKEVLEKLGEPPVPGENDSNG